MSKREQPRCGAPCSYGGRWMARKWSTTDLGMWNHCNRHVKAEGDHCWQHATQAATSKRTAASVGTSQPHSNLAASSSPVSSGTSAEGAE